jgi:hypothetical protein
MKVIGVNEWLIGINPDPWAPSMFSLFILNCPNNPSPHKISVPVEV